MVIVARPRTPPDGSGRRQRCPDYRRMGHLGLVRCLAHLLRGGFSLLVDPAAHRLELVCGRRHRGPGRRCRPRLGRRRRRRRRRRRFGGPRRLGRRDLGLRGRRRRRRGGGAGGRLGLLRLGELLAEAPRAARPERAPAAEAVAGPQTSAAAAPRRAPTPNAAFRFTRTLFHDEELRGKRARLATLGRLPASSSAPASPSGAGRRGRFRPREGGIGNSEPYEILLMLDPELPEERQKEIVARMRELVEQRGGTWVGHEPWGRRKLAYEIDHKREGTYHLVHFDADAETLDELSRVLKITDGVMRHLAVAPAGSGRVAGATESRRDQPRLSSSERVFDRKEEKHGQHQPRRPRREPDAGPRAAAHAERDGRLQAPHRREHAPEGPRHRRVGREAELLRRHRLGQPGRELRAVPLQGPARSRVDGRLDWREWEAQDGTKRQAVEIIADSVQFLGSRGDGEAAAASSCPPGAARRDRRLPRRPRPTTTSRSDGPASETPRRPSERRPAPADGGPARGRRSGAARLLLLQGEDRGGRLQERAQLRRYVSEKGKIRSRRITGACRRHQRQLAVAIKRAREMALLPVRVGVAMADGDHPPPGRREARPARRRGRRRARLRAELPAAAAARRAGDAREGRRARSAARRTARATRPARGEQAQAIADDARRSRSCAST